MAKPKETVEYFPHYCTSGKTIFILENNFGIQGYCFWFKLLELLAATPKHYYVCNTDEELEFLSARCKILPTLCLEILNKLAMLDAICQQLWEKKVIFSENFVRNIEYVYDRRTTALLHKEALCKQYGVLWEHNDSTISKNGISLTRTEQNRTESKEINKEKGDEIDWDFEKGKLVSDTGWQEHYVRINKYDSSRMGIRLSEYVNHLESGQDYKTCAKAKLHFANWNKIDLEKFHQQHSTKLM